MGIDMFMTGRATAFPLPDILAPGNEIKVQNQEAVSF
jgi:hypothetical protein